MRYWIGLGANLGDRRGALQRAVDTLAAAGVEVEAVSRVYETAPQGIEDQPPFLNAACRVLTALGPRELLAILKDIEAHLGRVEGPRFGPRAIDLDILLWEGGTWRDDRLEVPHPRLHERRFALIPLADVAPPGDVEAWLSALHPDAQPVEATAATLALPG